MWDQISKKNRSYHGCQRQSRPSQPMTISGVLKQDHSGTREEAVRTEQSPNRYGCVCMEPSTRELKQEDQEFEIKGLFPKILLTPTTKMETLGLGLPKIIEAPNPKIYGSYT